MRDEGRVSREKQGTRSRKQRREAAVFFPSTPDTRHSRFAPPSTLGTAQEQTEITEIDFEETSVFSVGSGKEEMRDEGGVGWLAGVV